MDYYALLYVVPNIVAFAIVTWVAYQVYKGKRTLYRDALFTCMSCISITVLILLAAGSGLLAAGLSPRRCGRAICRPLPGCG